MRAESPFNAVIDLDQIIYRSTDTAAIKLPYSGVIDGSVENPVIYVCPVVSTADVPAIRLIATKDGQTVTARIIADKQEIITMLDRLFDPSGISIPERTGLAPYTCGFLHGLFVSWRLFRSTDFV